MLGTPSSPTAQRGTMWWRRTLNGAGGWRCSCPTRRQGRGEAEDGHILRPSLRGGQVEVPHYWTVTYTHVMLQISTSLAQERVIGPSCLPRVLGQTIVPT
ncbi:unnamed protein product, partial [Choristocarpus tenellus]